MPNKDGSGRLGLGKDCDKTAMKDSFNKDWSEEETEEDDGCEEE